MNGQRYWFFAIVLGLFAACTHDYGNFRFSEDAATDASSSAVDGSTDADAAGDADAGSVASDAATSDVSDAGPETGQGAG